jgi:hypothetical protein
MERWSYMLCTENEKTLDPLIYGLACVNGFIGASASVAICANVIRVLIKP